MRAVRRQLMRMVDASLPLNQLDASTLSPEGKLIPADTAEGIAARNSLHNRVVADAFVPAGGRPATMNDANWRDFLTADGTPSAKVVVEGANLFLTPEVRPRLSEPCRRYGPIPPYRRPYHPCRRPYPPCH